MMDPEAIKAAMSVPPLKTFQPLDLFYQGRHLVPYLLISLTLISLSLQLLISHYSRGRESGSEPCLGIRRGSGAHGRQGDHTAIMTLGHVPGWILIESFESR